MIAKVPVYRHRRIAAYAIIDYSDLPLVSGRRWFLHKSGRPVCNLDGRQVKMRRVITGAPSDMEVDHKDHDQLNCQRINLRLCTHIQNCWNNKGYAPVSGKTGVYRNRGRWRAVIRHEGITRHLGTFDTIEEARAVRRREETRLRGEFAPQEVA